MLGAVQHSDVPTVLTRAPAASRPLRRELGPIRHTRWPPLIDVDPHGRGRRPHLPQHVPH
eukprot:3729179-Prymnesium_polylepis.3